MKRLILLTALPLLTYSSFAQTEKSGYKYSNNGFSVTQTDKQFANEHAGKIFYNRLKAFNKFNQESLKKYMSRDQFYKFMNLLSSSSKKASQSGYTDLVDDISTYYTNIKNLSRLSNEDGYRMKLYEISAPVYKVIDESWGEDIAEAVIDEAYLNLYEYINKAAASNPLYANASSYMTIDPIKIEEGTGQCLYTVKIDKPVLEKDHIEVYFTDLQLFNKLSKKYEGTLLLGPISGWAAMKDESEVVQNMLQAYTRQIQSGAHHVYAYDLEQYGNPSTIQQNLYKDHNWFVWVFRNGVLYYSYMAIPCSKKNMCTVYEERPVEGLGDDNGGSDNYYGDF